jgi:hypothetical protein
VSSASRTYKASMTRIDTLSFVHPATLITMQSYVGRIQVIQHCNSLWWTKNDLIDPLQQSH